MNKTVKKIGLILIAIIILPAAFFTINELTSLSENEKVIEKIYSDQLEAILFSVNQYSEDVASSWATKIDDLLDELAKVDEIQSGRMVDSLFNDLPSLQGFFVADSILDEKIDFFLFGELEYNKNADYDTLNTAIKNLLKENSQVVTRLFTYKRAGYRKIEPVNYEVNNQNSVLMFIDATPSGINKITGILINPNEFIYRILSPKIQEIAEMEFVISVFNRDRNFQYNSTKDYDSTKVQQERPLWIFPNYKVGISLVGSTIEDLVKDRVVSNIILISLLTLILIAGVYIVYRNVKREVEIAQIKSDFISNVSHELRTPLSLISMFAETLEMGRAKTEEKKREYYSIISREANRLGRIVNTILNFSKMEAGKRKYHFEENDLNIVIAKVFENYSFHLKKIGFDFNYYPSENLPSINIDEESVSEAVINLIDNAVKYSPDKKQIEIKTGIDNTFAYVDVTDKGIGISHEDQRNVFDKFFRVSSALVHDTKGTGLGLSIVKYVMDAHGGKVTLRSKAGAGSSFKLMFPVIGRKN
ncbi:MAG: HAMP domain-containing sensor histidine kinase [Ignavibacteriaceae bacterium]